MIIRKRRSVKRKVSDYKKEAQKEERRRKEGDEKESAWNLKEEDFDDL